MNQFRMFVASKIVAQSLHLFKIWTISRKDKYVIWLKRKLEVVKNIMSQRMTLIMQVLLRKLNKALENDIIHNIIDINLF